MSSLGHKSQMVMEKSHVKELDEIEVVINRMKQILIEQG